MIKRRKRDERNQPLPTSPSTFSNSNSALFSIPHTCTAPNFETIQTHTNFSTKQILKLLSSSLFPISSPLLL